MIAWIALAAAITADVVQAAEQVAWREETPAEKRRREDEAWYRERKAVYAPDPALPWFRAAKLGLVVAFALAVYAALR